MTNGCSARTAPAPPRVELDGGLWRLLEATGANALAHDGSGVVLFATAGFHAALGFENGALIGRSIDEVTLGSTRDATPEERWTRLYRGPDGRARVVVETETSLDLGAAETLRVRVIVDSPRADAFARGIDAYSRAIVARGPFGVAAERREDGVILFANTRFAEMLGKSLPEIVGSSSRDLYADGAQRERVIERLGSGTPVVDWEVSFRRTDGEALWTLLTVEPLEIEGSTLNLIWIHDHTERRRKEEALREMASRDPLTSLHNRRSFMELARRQLARSERLNEPLSVLVIDVDHFKIVNDTWGHAVGDEALRIIADAFTGTLRDYDLVARLGGEEFIIALSDTDVEGALGVAERVRRKIGRTLFPTGGEETFGLTISVGIASVEIESGGREDDLERAIHRADIALYRSKRLGRDRSSIFRPEVM